MAKITMQDIADALNISRVSVWKVFNNQPGVSDALRENVMSKAQELGYLKAVPEFGAAEAERTVALIVSRPDSATFWTSIIHRMAQELAEHHVNLLYTYVPSSCPEGFTLPATLTGKSVDGIIVLNVYDAKMVRLIDSLDIPKVYLDTVPQFANRSLNGDLLLIESYFSMYDITASVIKRGFTEIGFIGDTNYAKTNLDRHLGFCNCMKDHGLTVREDICLTSSIGIFSYYRELCDFLNSLPQLPQAFVCASDYIAHFLQQYFTEYPTRIADGIMVTGFDGSMEYTNIAELITTANVNTNLLGKRLSVQIIYRMDHSAAPYELTYVNPQIIYHDSIL